MTEQPARILLVDDEQSIQELLSFPLRQDGYDVVQAADGREGLDLFRQSHFDLVVLDVMMPRMDGFELCQRLRARSTVPIIMLTAKSEEVDKIVGLEIGADDYITKPFSVREFRSRVKALLRRSSIASEVGDDPEQLITNHEMQIDPLKRRVTVSGEQSELTFVEFEILSAMATSPGRVWSRDQLLRQVWGNSDYRDPRTVDVHIRHLREKLEVDSGEPAYILTVRGVGYRFREPA
jgi:DNA-binding response OmpR family regulator